MKDPAQGAEPIPRRGTDKPVLRVDAAPYHPTSGPVAQGKAPGLQGLRKLHTRRPTYSALDAVPFTPSQGIATPSPTNVAAGIWYSQYSPHLFSQPGTPGHPYAVVWGPDLHKSFRGQPGSARGSGSSRSDGSHFAAEGTPQYPYSPMAWVAHAPFAPMQGEYALMSDASGQLQQGVYMAPGQAHHASAAPMAVFPQGAFAVASAVPPQFQQRYMVPSQGYPPGMYVALPAAPASPHAAAPASPVYYAPHYLPQAIPLGSPSAPRASPMPSEASQSGPWAHWGPPRQQSGGGPLPEAQGSPDQHARTAKRPDHGQRHGPHMHPQHPAPWWQHPGYPGPAQHAQQASNLGPGQPEEAPPGRLPAQHAQQPGGLSNLRPSQPSPDRSRGSRPLAGASSAEGAFRMGSDGQPHLNARQRRTLRRAQEREQKEAAAADSAAMGGTRPSTAADDGSQHLRGSLPADNYAVGSPRSSLSSPAPQGDPSRGPHMQSSPEPVIGFVRMHVPPPPISGWLDAALPDEDPRQAHSVHSGSQRDMRSSGASIPPLSSSHSHAHSHAGSQATSHSGEQPARLSGHSMTTRDSLTSRHSVASVHSVESTRQHLLSLQLQGSRESLHGAMAMLAQAAPSHSGALTPQPLKMDVPPSSSLEGRRIALSASSSFQQPGHSPHFMG